jgi:hyperosmotically inducible protein
MLQRFAIVVAAAAAIATGACAQTDAGVTTAVKSKFAADDTVKAYQIDVDTADAVVTLSGTVENPAAKERAVMIARETSGVRDVVDRITVSRDAAVTPGDVKDSVDHAASDARDRVREGADAAKDSGREVAATTGQAADRGGAAMTDGAITAGVKTKFLADTSVSGLKIDVDTQDGAVTLTGTVPTRAEADRAVSLARDTSGVKRVVNNLRVER